MVTINLDNMFAFTTFLNTTLFYQMSNFELAASLASIAFHNIIVPLFALDFKY